MSEQIKKIIDDSGKTRYQIAKETGIHLRTLDKWYYGETVVNVVLIKLLMNVSSDEKEFYENAKKILKEK